MFSGGKQLDLTTLQLAYLLPFLFATAGCLAALAATRRVRDRATRRGLAGLLALSALWAGTEAARVVVVDPRLGGVVYVVGLIVGFGSVFAWLYFVSAYTGANYHERARYRWAGLGLYGAVVSFKLTNPIHGLYFELAQVGEPFVHLTVSYGVLNWAVLGLAYLLSGIGFLRLWRFFAASPWNTRTLAMLAGVTLLPIVGTLAGRVTRPSTLVAVNYEPLGVAVFAVGTLFVVLDSFRATLGEYGGAIDRITDAVVVVDRDGVIQRTNATAREAFPALAGATGEPLDALLPGVVTDQTDGDDPSDTDGTESVGPGVWPDASSGRVGASSRQADASSGRADDASVNGESEPEEGTRENPRTSVVSVDDRRWLRRASAVSLGPHEVGTVYVLTDVTEFTRQQSELVRQNRQLEAFAEAIAHELRNGVAVADGHLGRVQRALAEPAEESASGSTTDPDGSTDHAGDASRDAEDDADLTSGLDPAATAEARDAAEHARSGVERIQRVVDDLVTLTRLGQTVRADEYESCSLAGLARAATADVPVRVVIDGDAQVEADPVRLERLLNRAATFAAANGAGRLVVTPRPDGFVLADDGESLASADGLFAYGDAVPDAQTGMLLPMVRSLAHVHGWTVDADSSYDDGVRYVVSDATVSVVESPSDVEQSAGSPATSADSTSTVSERVGE